MKNLKFNKRGNLPHSLALLIAVTCLLTPSIASADVTDNLQNTLLNTVNTVKDLVQSDTSNNQKDHQEIVSYLKSHDTLLAGINDNVSSTKAVMDELAEKGGLTINTSGTVRKTINGTASLSAGGFAGGILGDYGNQTFTSSRIVSVDGVTDYSKCRVYINGSMGGCSVTPSAVDHYYGSTITNITGNVSGQMSSETQLNLTFTGSGSARVNGFTIYTTVSYTIEEYW